jgi:hypothetical protein
MSPAVCLIVLFLLSIISHSHTTTVYYTASYENIPNPERGWSPEEITFSSPLSPLDPNNLAGYTAQNYTLIRRFYYLNGFQNSSINSSYLAMIQQDFQTLRSAGMKEVVRFAYTNNQSTPYADAPLNIILMHISQLTSILVGGKDVILLIEAGFIGVWGEWAYSSYFDFSPQGYANRLKVVEAILGIDPSIPTAVRTPDYTMIMLNTSQACTSQQAFTDATIARIGQFNDCFLASSTDEGTYPDASQSEYPWLHNETMYVSMGGETCAVDSPRSDCPTALSELALFHYTYLNSLYQSSVLQGWMTQGCYNNITLRFGYRFVLISSEVTIQSTNLMVNLTIQNVGFAAPFLPKTFQFILSNGIAQYAFPVNEDVRTWLPELGVFSVSFQIQLNQVPLGTYDVLLQITDIHPSLANLPAYSIQFANENIWNATLAANDLFQNVNVTQSTFSTTQAQSGRSGSTFLIPSTLSFLLLIFMLS